MIIVPHSYRMVMGIDDDFYFFEDWSWSWKKQVETSQFEEAFFSGGGSEEIDIGGPYAQSRVFDRNGRKSHWSMSSTSENDNAAGDFEFFLNTPKPASRFSFRFSSARRRSSSKPLASEYRDSFVSSDWADSRRETGF